MFQQENGATLMKKRHVFLQQTEMQMYEEFERMSRYHQAKFSLLIHHGGSFRKFPNHEYREGKTDMFDFVDMYCFSVHELDAMFCIQNQPITLSLADFVRILGIPSQVQCAFTDEWSLDALSAEQETSGPYRTEIPTPDEIKTYVQSERVVFTRTYRGEVVPLHPNIILTKEVNPGMKSREEIIQDNVFCLGGNRYHLPASLAHMLYCVVTEKQYNLTYFIAKGMEFVKYIFYDRVMLPLGAPIVRKPRNNIGAKRGRHSTSSSSAYHHGSSSHPDDDDVDMHDEGTCHQSTLSPTTYHHSLSPIIKAYLEDLMDTPPRVAHPPPPQIQDHQPMDVTISLSPINPLDYAFAIASPPSSPYPIMGYHVQLNLVELHGANCLCCLHNRNLIFA
ncbi:hypothetical protein Tco_1561997 [Tanacetum coccineum]